jgi:hypothetical protein
MFELPLGGGAPLPPRHAASRPEAREVLLSRWLGPRYPSPSFHLATPAQPAFRGCSAARKRRCEGAVAFHGQTERCSCRHRAGECGWEMSWLAARSSREMMSLRVPYLLKRGCGRRGANVENAGPEGFMRSRGRGSDAQGPCPCVVSLLAEVDRRRRTQRSVRSPLHPIWGAYRDGGLANGRHASAKAPRRARGERVPRAESKRKPIT